MKRNVMSLLFVALISLVTLHLTNCGTTPASAPVLETVYAADFEGGLVDGWRLERGWQVIRDGTDWVLAGQGHSWARANESYNDVHLSYRVKLVQGRIHLVFRMDAIGRYFIGFDENGSSLSKQYWPDTFLYTMMYRYRRRPCSWRRYCRRSRRRRCH